MLGQNKPNILNQRESFQVKYLYMLNVGACDNEGNDQIKKDGKYVE